MVQQISGLRTIEGRVQAVNQKDGYKEVIIPAGTEVRLEVAEGATVENIVFDQTASGAGASVWAQHGDHDEPSAMVNNYTLRNIAWRGGFPRNSNWRPLFFSSAGPNCLIENIYLGDGIEGDVTGAHNATGGSFYARSSTGHVTFRNAYVNGFADNGIYASAPGDVGRGGTIKFENIRSEGNHVSQLRCGSDGDEVINCCVIPSPGRGFWYKGTGTVNITDCRFVAEGVSAGVKNPVAMDISGGRAVLTDTKYNTISAATQNNATVVHRGSSAQVDSPQPFWPNQAPRTWEDAATGSGGGGGRDAFDEPVCIQDIV